MFEKNTKEVNRLIAKMFAACTIAVILLVACSYFGVFEFGKTYTLIVLIVGLIVTITPSVFIHILSDNVMKYYMMIILSVFIGVLGTNNHIGIYMTYALVPIFSCLYFEPKFTQKMSVFAYIVMIIAVYFNSATKFDVVYLGVSHRTIFIAYALGFTIEYVIINSILYMYVKRAKSMMEARYSAEEANRMKSKFLSSMSHEIRTPMNAIIGMSDVALQKDMSEDVRKCIDIINSSSKGLLHIVNDILDLSKIEAGKLNIIAAPYKTASLVEDMIAVTDARNTEKKVPIYYHVPDSMPEQLEGDVIRIKQVMLNYASNAIKYTECGQIDITISFGEEHNGYIDMTYMVSDTGQGIKKEDIGKLFKIYGQLDAEKNHSKEGTGIGLAISKYFVDNMGGNVHVDSIYGEGSTFSFTIPQRVVVDGKGTLTSYDENQKADTSYYFATQNVRVLLVDDNRLNREVVKELLAPLDMVIDEAENGLQAVNMSENTSYDMIFMDSHMPIMNGEEATIRIRSMSESASQTTTIIAITADAVPGVKERLIECGMNDYVVKPIDVKLLCGVIRKYLPKEKIISCQ